jgi:hypothetical protein
MVNKNIVVCMNNNNNNSNKQTKKQHIHTYISRRTPMYMYDDEIVRQ